MTEVSFYEKLMNDKKLPSTPKYEIHQELMRAIKSLKATP